MDKLKNKGFTLIEIMVVMMMVSLFSLVFASKLVPFDETVFNPIHCQLKAMSKRSICQFNDTIHYNQNGNINHAQTINFKTKTCIFQLGMGRYRCE